MLVQRFWGQCRIVIGVCLERTAPFLCYFVQRAHLAQVYIYILDLLVRSGGLKAADTGVLPGCGHGRCIGGVSRLVSL